MVVVTSCGDDNTYRVYPDEPTEINITSLESKFKEKNILVSSEHILIVMFGKIKVSIFPDGRMIIKDVPTEEDAEKVSQKIFKIIRK